MTIQPGQPACPIEEQTERLSRMIWADSVNQFSEWLRECREVFSTFHDCLARHIRFEEAVQVHERLVETRSMLRRDVDRLRGEHQKMLDECRRIGEQLIATAETDSPASRAIVRRLENLIAFFRRHESEERRIVRDVFGDPNGCVHLGDFEPPPCPHQPSTHAPAKGRE